jgi:hypothetical protein
MGRRGGERAGCCGLKSALRWGEDGDEGEEGLRAGHWRLVGSGVTDPGYRVGDWVGHAEARRERRRRGGDEDEEEWEGGEGEEEAALPRWGASGLAWGKLQRAAAVQGLGGSGVDAPGYRVGWGGRG